MQLGLRPYSASAQMKKRKWCADMASATAGCFARIWRIISAMTSRLLSSAPGAASFDPSTGMPMR